MAKKLLIVRHGKAENPDFGMQDFVRKLTKSGAADAIAVAEKLLQKNIVPELLISSSAKRAYKTAQLFAATWNIPIDSIVLQPAIYEASVKQLIALIEKFDNGYDFIAIFGHNPGFTDLINYLAEAGIYDFSTSGAALIEFEVNSWSLITAGGQMAFLAEP